MKTCIINFSDSVFIKGQTRLKRSLIKVGYTGDILFFNHPLSNWPKHENVPMGFKVYAFEEAFKKGYENVLWLDSACIATRPLDKIFGIMSNNGIFAFSRFNASVGEWSSDHTLTAANISRNDAFKIPELVTCAIGINIDHKNGKFFYNEWRKVVDDGISFLGLYAPFTYKDSLNNDNKLLSKDLRVKGQRWDQTTASIIVNKIGLIPTNRLIFDIVSEAKSGKYYADYVPLDTIIVQNRDIKTATYLEDISNYEKVNFWVLIRTIERRIKDLIKWATIYYWKYRYPAFKKR